MGNATTLEQGLTAFKKRAWLDAYAHLSKAEQEVPLKPGELEILAESAYLTGKVNEATDYWNRAHHAFLKQENPKYAARCAYWLGMTLLLHGNGAQGSGWIARAERLINKYELDCAEKGLLLVPEALQFLSKGEYEKAHDLFSRAVEIGNRFDNAELITLGRLGCGQSLVLLNKMKEGTTLLDEVMVAVLSDEISPIVTGIVYCAVIETCQKIYDIERAQEWTGALSRWCESHPELVPFRGQCLVRRVEIMQLHGEWEDAMNEVQRACELLSQPPGEPAAGEAYYRQGELHRLLGNLSNAEEMYRWASKWGKNPQPGMSLLRLARDELEGAVTAIQQSEKEKQDQIGRSEILPAYIDIMLTAENIQPARKAALELSEIATDFESPFLRGIAARSEGNVLLAEGKPRTAIDKLRHSCLLFKNMEATYEYAKARVLLGTACREIGDEDTAQMELDAARWMFQKLGASADLAKVETLLQKPASAGRHGLTPREMEVLQLLATGKTNKVIAAELYISERTVDRHVSNILSKLNASSRSAATAYAYEHHLI